MGNLIFTLLEILVLGAAGALLFDLLFLTTKRMSALLKLAGEFGALAPDDQGQLLAYRKAQEAVMVPPAAVGYARSFFLPLLVLLVCYLIFFHNAEFNFPLVLVLAVFGTGFIWLFDIVYLREKRRRLIDKVDKQLRCFEDDAEKENGNQISVREIAAKEPLEVEYSKSFFPVLLLVLVLRSFLVEPFQIPSASMVPTLEIGDFILVNKFTYGIRLPVLRNKVIEINEPERGDVMVFFPPHKNVYFIKRVIGLPGDEIRYINNVLYVNGEMMPQQHVASLPAGNPQYQIMKENLNGVEHIMRKHMVPGRLSVSGVWVVPEGHYFMMGDNRDNSSDSREWGPVPEKNIVGKAFGIWMHWENFLSIPSFSRVGVIQ